jgi:signal transduction histidine kinase
VSAEPMVSPQEFHALLRRYLDVGGEDALLQSYQLGRRTLAEGMGILGLISNYQKALRRVLQDSGASAEILRVLTGAEACFVESLSAYEMAHLTHREASTAWKFLNERLESEVKRIAHALHDEAGQLLVMAHISLGEAAQEIPSRKRKSLNRTAELLDRIEEELRRLSHELRPTILDDLGLLPAVEFLAEGVSRRSGVSVRVEGEIESRLPPGQELALYRVVQEALSNITRHAQAKQACIRLSREGSDIVCTVRDDGIGFDKSKVLATGIHSGLGLIGFQERLAALGGTVAISTSPGQGTELVFRIPLENRDVSANSAR